MVYTELGKYNVLKILKEVDFGVYLDGGVEFGEILMPKRYVTDEMKIGDEVSVFIYLDGEERVVATTEIPFAQVGEMAYLKVRSVNDLGAFLDWGIMKDLFLPYKEQTAKIIPGHSYFVYIYVDEKSQRIAATMKVDKYLDKLPHKFQVGEEHEVFIYKRTDIGFKAIIGHTHTGMLYNNEIHQDLRVETKVNVFIKNIREDGKIDLTLQKQGSERIFDAAEFLLEKLQDEGGFLPYTDKTNAEIIYQRLGMSKKTFKQALGKLYKDRKVKLGENGFQLS